VSRRPVTCAAPCCRAPIDRGNLLCEAHWLSLPKRLRNALGVTWRARQMSAFQENWTEALVILDPTPGIFEAPRPRRVTPPTIAFGARGEQIIYATGRML